MIAKLSAAYRCVLTDVDDDVQIDIEFHDADASTWTTVQQWTVPQPTAASPTDRQLHLMDTAQTHGWRLPARWPKPQHGRVVLEPVEVLDWLTVIGGITTARDQVIDRFGELDRAWQHAIAAAATQTRGARTTLATAAGISVPRINQMIRQVADHNLATDTGKAIHLARTQRRLKDS